MKLHPVILSDLKNIIGVSACMSSLKCVLRVPMAMSCLYVYLLWHDFLNWQELANCGHYSTTIYDVEYMHVCILVFIHVCTHMCMHTCKHAFTCVHTIHTVGSHTVCNGVWSLLSYLLILHNECNRLLPNIHICMHTATICYQSEISSHFFSLYIKLWNKQW